MERDLDTKLDWVAVDHFNTGHPHTHIVIRGRDRDGGDLVMAREYIAHGVRARAQALITLELGPETEVERVQKLFNEVGQERLTRLDRSLIARAKDGVLVISTTEEADPVQQTLRVGRLKTLERLGLAKERQQGVWALDSGAERKLRQLGERADKFKMMQRALKEASIERAAASMALFERGPRKAPLIGKVVGVGLVDEITDRTGSSSMPSTVACTMPSLAVLSPARYRPGACSWRSAATASRSSRRFIRGYRSSRPSSWNAMPPMTARPGSIRQSSPSGARTVRPGALRPTWTMPLPRGAAGWLRAGWRRSRPPATSRRSPT
jgi:hypothetical protein